jgi:hypothetical protein
VGQGFAGLAVATAGNGDGQVFHHRIMADHHQRAQRPVLPDDGEIAGGIRTIEGIGENDAPGVGMRRHAFQRLTRPPGVGA